MHKSKLIDSIKTILLRGVDLCDNGCKGVPDSTLPLVHKGLKSLFGAIADDTESLSICETADRYNVTTTTIYNWLEKHNLPKPKKIEDVQRVNVPRWVIDELDKHHEHKV